MSILINMEMPTRCFSCPMCDVENAEVNCVFSHGSYIEYRDVDPQIAVQARPDWCPIVEIPPHGRLIDADKMIEKYEELIERSKDGVIHMTYHDVIVEAIYDLKQAPTVIPDDKEKT